MTSTGKKVVLYELNEVPWNVVDTFVAAHPTSNLAGILGASQQLTTVIGDPTPLQPWRTWPSFHTSQLAADHNSYDLGQDPATFRGQTIWDVAEEAHLKIGLFGPMQSWPARKPKHGGFWVPDTFARDATCYPSSIDRFQAFNLNATKDNSFAPDANLKAKDLAGVGYDLLRQGLTPASAWYLTKEVLRERRDPRYKAGRSILQALPCFDLYWKLHRRYQPDLSIFFTNHVAGMMHRYWGDAMAGYHDVDPDYRPDPIYRTLIDRAMSVVDGQLGRVRALVDRDPATILIIAGSMGQTAVPRIVGNTQMVLGEPDKLFGALELGPLEIGSAMYPQFSLLLPPQVDAEVITSALRSVALADGQPVFTEFRLTGRSLQFAVQLDLDLAAATLTSAAAHFTPVGASGPQQASLAALGLEVRDRPGGGNTGYHIPQGICITYGAGITPNASRFGVDQLDMAPSILANLLGVDPAPTMKGKPSLFKALAATSPAPSTISQ